MRRSSATGAAATSPSVWSPWALSRCAERGPIPGSRSTASGARNAASSPARTTANPCGLPLSQATLATSLLGASPTELGSPHSTRMRPCIRWASPSASVMLAAARVRSTYASSIETCSTRSDSRASTAMTRLECSRYAGKRGERTTASGQSRTACAMGIAEWHPKARAS